MSAWRTDFVFDLGADPRAVEAFVAATPTWWRRFLPGIHVRVRGGKVKAYCTDFSPQPSWPVLRGRLVTDASGRRLEGTLSWAFQKSWPLLYTLLAVVCLCGVVGAALVGARADALVLLGCAMASFALAAWLRHGEADERLEHERELRAGLEEMLAG